MKRLLLLGGGHAHVHVLQGLAREPARGVELCLVTPYLRQMYSGMVPGLVAGHYEVDQVQIPLAPLVAAAGVQLRQTHVVALDAGRRQVTLADGQVLAYDLLSIDTGSEMNRDRLPGARAHALFVRPIEGFVQMLDALVDRASRRALDLAVIGGGAAGFELATALEHRLHGLAAEPTRVALVTGGPPPLDGYPLRVVHRAARALQSQRITVFLDSCSEVAVDHLRLSGGSRLACDLAIMATGGDAPGWVQGSGLALGAAGHVQTGPTLQSLSHPEVLAAGDVAERPDAPHPRSGVYAVRAGPPLLANLRRALAGQPLQPHRPQARTLNLLSCGRRAALASWGGWSAQGAWVWWWKDHIDRAFVRRYTRAG